MVRGYVMKFVDAVGKRRRRFVRVAPEPNAPIEVQIMGPEFLEIRNAKDVSEGGLAIVVPHGFAGYDLEAELEVLVHLPGETTFSARARVRHSRESGDRRVFGVAFIDLADSARATLRRYIERRRP